MTTIEATRRVVVRDVAALDATDRERLHPTPGAEGGRGVQGRQGTRDGRPAATLSGCNGCGPESGSSHPRC